MITTIQGGMITKKTQKSLKMRMLKALESTLCNITHSAQLTGIDRRTHYTWVETDEEYRKAVEELEVVQYDFVKSKLFQLVKSGDVAATIYATKCLGRKFGWTEKLEIEHSGAIEITMSDPYADQN